MADEIPEGFHENTPEKLKIMEDIGIAAAKAGAGQTLGVAVLIVFNDSTCSCALSLSPDVRSAAMAYMRLQRNGNEVLQTTLARMLLGKGVTTVLKEGE
jgi:hypothetical protein